MSDKFGSLKLLILCLLAGICICPLTAQSSLNISLVSQTTTDFSTAYYVMLDGNRAYVANSGSGNGGLMVFDATNPAQPIEIGEIFYPDNTVAITVTGNYLYCIVGGTGVRIFNVADVQNPILVGQVDSYVFANRIMVKDGYLYAGSWSGVKIFNVSDPYNPYYVSNISHGDTDCFTVSGNYLYLAYDGDPPMPDFPNHDLLGFAVYNISNPAQPVLAGGFEYLSGVVSEMEAAGNRVYLANSSWGLLVVDVSNPAVPVVAGSLDTNSYTLALEIAGNSVCLTDGDNGLWFVDISNPDSPQTITHVPLDNLCTDLALTGNYLYAANLSLKVFDISNPALPQQVFSLYRPIRIENVKVSGNYAYAVEYNQGLRIFDITDLLHPQQVGYFAMNNARRVAVEGNYAYLAGGTSGMNILNISNPAEPQVAGFYQYSVSELEVNGAYVYVTPGSQYFWVLDVSNPAQPERIYTINFGIANAPAFTKIKKSVNNVYLGTLYSGLKILDLTDPAAPIVVGSMNNTGQTKDIDIRANYAYLVYASGMIDIVDVSNAASPVMAGSFEPSDLCEAISIVGDYAYLAGNYSGIYAFYLGNPVSPLMSGFYNTAGVSYNIAMQNGYAFVADRYCVGIYDCSEAVGVDDNIVPETLAGIRINSYPNPFRKTVSISIDLTEQGRYDLAVYNIKGQKINSLYSGFMSKGSNTFAWDGTDSSSKALSNGFYLLQVTSEHQKAIHKVLLVN